MKKMLLLVTLLLTSCSMSDKGTLLGRYKNVFYTYNKETHTYKIKLNMNDDEAYLVDISKVYSVNYRETNLYNEFFIYSNDKFLVKYVY